MDLPGAAARLARERRTHGAVASLTAETRNPQAGDPARSCAAEPRNVARVFASGDVLDLLADARPERVMGHFRAREAPRRALRRVESHGDVLLRAPAARAFASMRTHASRDGVLLTPVSGFRDVDRQHGLFFDVAADRGQSLQKRALVSAPPGFSEHHTGYALDISCPEVGDDLVVAFEKTGAFAWLSRNAAKHGFEMSFGRDDVSSLGVSYEPWHWRWVGDTHSRETFARTREATGRA
jgi:D-alanyl-D-alanine carboxypeptidase